MLKCVNPTTGKIIDTLSCDDRRTVAGKVQRLQQGHRDWRRLGWSERARIIQEFGRRLGEVRPEFVDWLCTELGMPIRQARIEITATIGEVEDLAEYAAIIAAEQVANGDHERYGEVAQESLGVVAHLSTWCSPCLLGVQAMIPALLAGNAVIYKPSEHAVLVGRLLVETMWEAGIPRNVIDFVTGDGTVGDYILDEDVAAVALTGSSATGRMVAEKLARRMIPRHLELSGKKGVYVCDDIDIEGAAGSVADGAFYNSGQGCRAIERVYVHEQVYRRFTEAICDRVSAYSTGNPRNESTYVGPLVSTDQIDMIEYQIGDAVQKGGRLLLGGRAQGGRGHFFEPTVLVDTDHRMLVMREETLGPLVALQRVGDDAEALHHLMDTEYGLAAGIFSSDRDRACQLLDRLEVEDVYWNDSHQGWVNRGESGAQLMAHFHEVLHRYTRHKSWHLPRV